MKFYLLINASDMHTYYVDDVILLSFRTSTYQVIHPAEFISWTEAEETCQREDGHLISFEDEEEYAYILNHTATSVIFIGRYFF